MTPDNFSVFVATLQTVFPWASLIPNEAAMDIWFRKLEDIPDHVANAVLSKWLDTHSAPPSIAEIRAEAASLTNGPLPTWSDGWAQVQKAVGRYGYLRREEALASMDELTRATVKNLGWQQICESENIDNIRANFRMAYEALAKRKQEDRLLSAGAKEELSAIQGQCPSGKLITDLAGKMKFLKGDT